MDCQKNVFGQNARLIAMVNRLRKNVEGVTLPLNLLCIVARVLKN